MKLRHYRFALPILAASLLFNVAVSARTWTSSDGSKTFEGELASYNAESGDVVVALTNGKKLNFKQAVLSVADIEFLKEKGTFVAEATKAPAAAPASGGNGIAKAITGEIPKSDGKSADMTKPVQVFIMMGQSNMVGMGKTEPESNNGSLEFYCKTEKKYPYLLADDGSWAERKDVRCAMVTCDQESGWLKPGFGAKNNIGPELGFGYVVGAAIDAPVFLLKACIGNRSLGWDLLPPGSEPYEFEGAMVPGYRGTPSNPKGNGEKVANEWYAGKQYDDDTDNAKAALADLEKHYPGAKGYEVAGFVFWQGEKDGGSAANAAQYEKNLVQFIKQLRKDFNAPNAKFVLGTLGEATKGSGGNGGKILEAQLAVDGAEGKHPEFKGNVSTVYTNPLSNGGSGNGHYGGNAGTYMNVGEAMGKAMVDLLK